MTALLFASINDINSNPVGIVGRQEVAFMGRVSKIDYPRVFAVAAALALAALLSVVVMGLTAPPAKADDTECVGILPPGTYDNVVVPEGTFCFLSNSMVKGNVKALPDSLLSARDNTIRSNIEGDKADVVDIVSTDGVPDTIEGSVQAKEGNRYTRVCGQNLTQGNIQVEKFGPEGSGVTFVVIGDDQFCSGIKRLVWIEIISSASRRKPTEDDRVVR